MRRFVWSVVLIAALVTVVDVGLRVANLPGIVPAVRLATATPSATPGLFPARVVAAGEERPWDASPGGLPDTVIWQGQEVSFEAFADETATNAVVAVRDGVLVGEWYRDGFGPDSAFPSYSVAKSVVSLLVGQAVGEGVLSEDDRIGDIVPWLSEGDAFDSITVGDLLDMESGVDVGEVYENPLSPVARMYATTDLDDFLASHRDLMWPPGSEFDYRSVDTALLGVVLEEVTGKRVADLASERLWKPIGAEADATWSLDRADGREKAFCCFNATARDMARIGTLMLGDGQVNGEQVVPNEWIDRITERPVDIGGGWGYSAQWWHPPGGEVAAIGIHGQFIVVDADEATVVVRFADDRLDRPDVEILAVLDQLVEG